MNSLIEHHRDQLADLCRRHHVRRLEAFGSAVGDRFDPRSSDLDFLVELDHLDPEACADAYFGLLDALETLLHRPVDLVMTSAVTNPHFLHAIASSRTLLYADPLVAQAARPRYTLEELVAAMRPEDQVEVLDDVRVPPLGDEFL